MNPQNMICPILTRVVVLGLPLLAACGSNPQQQGDVSPAGDDGGTRTDSAPEASSDAPYTAKTVHGRVVDEVGIGLAAKVMIDGHPSTTTDADGNFRIEDVDGMYDVSVVRAAGVGARVTIFRALTRRDPELSVAPNAARPSVATVDGALSGAGFVSPAPSDVGTYVQMTRADWSAGGAQTYGAGFDGKFALGCPLTASGPPSGTLYALQYRQDARGLPTAFLAFGTLGGVALVPQGLTYNADVPMRPVATGSFTGNANVPAGATGETDLFLHVNDNYVLVSRDPQVQGAFAYPTPDVAGATVSVQLIVRLTDGGDASVWGEARPNGAVAIDVPREPVLAAPATGTSVGPSTSFTWQPPTPGVDLVYRVMFSAWSPSEPSYEIVTTERSVTLPDVRAVDVTPGSGKYNWSVKAYPALLPSMDAFAEPGKLERFRAYGASGRREYTPTP